MNIPIQRLSNQYLAGNKFRQPSEVVEWLGAVQAQDYPSALWAVGQRTSGATQVEVEKAIADKSIVRTWPMRGTLHFVPARDVRWMLKLLTQRVIARSTGRYRQLELDERIFARCGKVLERALNGGKQLTRQEIYALLEAAKISVAGQRGIHILGHLAQDGLICFGIRRGKQQTFTLLDEWLPDTLNLHREEGLAKLTKSYFRSHGPATLQDFAWWSGLKMSEARAGIEMVQGELIREVNDGQTYWSTSSNAKSRSKSTAAALLPVYDEYTVAYKDRSAVLDSKYLSQTGNGIFRHAIVVDGQVVGTWNRAFNKDEVVITTCAFKSFKQTECRALHTAAARYGKFLGASVVLQ